MKSAVDSKKSPSKLPDSASEVPKAKKARHYPKPKARELWTEPEHQKYVVNHRIPFQNAQKYCKNGCVEHYVWCFGPFLGVFLGKQCYFACSSLSFWHYCEFPLLC